MEERELVRREIVQKLNANKIMETKIEVIQWFDDRFYKIDFDNLDPKEKIKYKAERQAKKQAPAIFEMPFKPGDILYNSWGYDQTNIDFYQVTRCTKASVFIRPIKAEYSDRSAGCDMAAYVTPLKNEFTGEEIRKKIQWYDGNAYIKFEFGGCSRYKDGDEIYCSWYA